MNYIRHLNAFFTQIKKDDRLTSAHVSLYLALFQYWNFNRFQNPFAVYRTNIMELSKIGSKNTYHKCIKLLHQAGYIIYHPAPSRYLPVKISLIRLDIKQPHLTVKQLNLFTTMNESAYNISSTPNTSTMPANSGGREGAPSPSHLSTHVPDLTDAGPGNGTRQVPDPVHLIKQQNISINNVSHPPTKNNQKNKSIPNQPYTEMKKQNTSTHVPDLIHATSIHNHAAPSLTEVETFFKEQYYGLDQARKFFYYNSAKNWMLTEKVPITNWKSLAHKWMLNDHYTSTKEAEQDLDTQLQQVYKIFLAGERVSKLLLAEFFDHLQLQLTPSIMQQAVQRRINQLSGSNEYTHNQLWQAYTNNDPQNEWIKKDYPNLFSLAKRLAVLKEFQKQKAKGQTHIHPPKN